MGTRVVAGRSPFSWISVLIVLALASPASASTPSQASYDVAELLVEADRLDLEGLWQEAESAYARAIEAAEKTLGPRDPLVARALIGAADLRARMDPVLV